MSDDSFCRTKMTCTKIHLTIVRQFIFICHFVRHVMVSLDRGQHTHDRQWWPSLFWFCNLCDSLRMHAHAYLMVAIFKMSTFPLSKKTFDPSSSHLSQWAVTCQATLKKIVCWGLHRGKVPSMEGGHSFWEGSLYYSHWSHWSEKYGQLVSFFFYFGPILVALLFLHLILLSREEKPQQKFF